MLSNQLRNLISEDLKHSPNTAKNKKKQGYTYVSFIKSSAEQPHGNRRVIHFENDLLLKIQAIGLEFKISDNEVIRRLLRVI